jgi:voltage-gated sodium channel
VSAPSPDTTPSERRTTRPPPADRRFATFCRELVASRAFRDGVVALILANAALLGLATWPAFGAAYGRQMEVASLLLQAMFVVEIAIRIGAHGRRPAAFFRDGWNLFDFAVVALSLLPASGPFATVARLTRVLRVARLVPALPDLRLIIGTMLRSIPSIGHVLILLSLLLYVYGVLGVKLFGEADPARWLHLGRALETLFQCLTLEGWAEVLATVRPGRPWAWLYFASFIFVAVFVVVNLFVAVMINNLEKAKRDEASAALPADGSSLRHELARLRDGIVRLEALAEKIER